MTVSIWQADDSQEIREVDVLVVGAGLVGSAAAYFVSQTGREVVVTDARDLAMGASSRNAGFLITGLDSYYQSAIDRYGRDVVREVWNLSRRSVQYVQDFAARNNVPLDQCGSYLLAETDDEAREIEVAARLMNEDGIPCEFLSEDPLNRGYCAAIAQPWDAAIQPYKLVEAIFRESGAELISNNEVYHLSQTDDTYAVVHTRKTIFHAQHVLLCTNAYSPQIDPYFVGKIIPTRAQVIVTAPLKNGPVLNTCGYSDYGYMYYRDTFDGRLLIGGGRKQNKALEGGTTDDRITDPVQQVLENYLRERFPDVDAPIERRWAGIMGFSVDGMPLVGRLPDRPRIGFAVGFTGHGLSLGAGVAERAVDMLLNDAHPGAVSAERLH